MGSRREVFEVLNDTLLVDLERRARGISNARAIMIYELATLVHGTLMQSWLITGRLFS